jgi:hypothetical protein
MSEDYLLQIRPVQVNKPTQKTPQKVKNKLNPYFINKVTITIQYGIIRAKQKEIHPNTTYNQFTTILLSTISQENKDHVFDCEFLRFGCTQYISFKSWVNVTNGMGLYYRFPLIPMALLM